MDQVNVLMSSYNGERYIKDQVESILKQKSVNIKLFIRDDGSTDNTVELLKNLKKKHDNLYIEIGDNIGYKKSFLSLVELTHNEQGFFAFADQDDIWLEDKLISALIKLNSLPQNKPNLYYSSLIFTDENLNVLGKKSFEDRIINLGNTISHSNIPGCTMVFNSNLAKKVVPIIKNADDIWGHDNWIISVSLLLDGNIYYDKNSYIYFRRHTEAQTSLNKSLLKKFKKRFFDIINYPNRSLLASKLLYNTYRRQIDNETIDLLKKIINYNLSWSNTVRLLKDSRIYTKNRKVDLWIIIKILFRIY